MRRLEKGREYLFELGAQPNVRESNSAKYCVRTLALLPSLPRAYAGADFQFWHSNKRVAPPSVGKRHLQRLIMARVPTFRDVIKSGSFAAPMTNWVTLAAAVSKPEFDGQLRRALDWEVKQFRRYGVDVGDYEALARRIRPNGLVRKKNESAEAFCRRIFMRRPSWQKSPQDALGPRGRRWPAG